MSARITFLGGDETGNVGSVKWGEYAFQLNNPTVCDDPHIIAKARANKFFRVDGDDHGQASIDKEAKVAPHPSKAKAKDEK
jgi:hypothetical protein